MRIDPRDGHRGQSANATTMAVHAIISAEDVYAAFHRVVTVQGDTPAQRAVMIAELDIGVMLTPRPQPSMQANASTAGGTPSAAGSGPAAPITATTATGLRPSCPVAMSNSGISSGTVTDGSSATRGARPLAGSTLPSATP